jgi:hypothetical protein
MTEASEQELQTAVEGTRTGLAAYRTAQDDAVARHADAVVKLEEADNTIHAIEADLHNKRRDLERWHNFREHQARRKVALERKIIAGRAFIRAVEDDDLGLD